jgi:hypothetical protein
LKLLVNPDFVSEEDRVSNSELIVQFSNKFRSQNQDQLARLNDKSLLKSSIFSMVPLSKDYARVKGNLSSTLDTPNYQIFKGIPQKQTKMNKTGASFQSRTKVPDVYYSTWRTTAPGSEEEDSRINRFGPHRRLGNSHLDGHSEVTSDLRPVQ